MEQRLVFYAQGHRPPDKHSRIYVPVFTDIAYAKAWLDFFTEGEEVRREDNTLLFESGLKLRCEQLDQIVSCGDMTAELSDKDTRRILRFKYGSWDERHIKVNREDVSASPRPERERRPERPPGYITITELCAVSGMPAMIARAALRASGREKPPYGWAFDPKDIPEIKKICGMK